MTADLLDHLQDAGYEPSHDDDLFDLVVSGTGSVRVCLYPNDGDAAEVCAFDAYLGCLWHARFSPGTPDAAVIAVIEAAEWELAVRRGAPVTPAQMKSAR